MTDLEMTHLCAEAIGIETELSPLRGTIMRYWYWNKGKVIRKEIYDPLHDDAQAMALVKRFRLLIEPPATEGTDWAVICSESAPKWGIHSGIGKTPNRAIVECVAKMQAAKVKA